jgi:hypothetical protein
VHVADHPFVAIIEHQRKVARAAERGAEQQRRKRWSAGDDRVVPRLPQRADAGEVGRRVPQHLWIRLQQPDRGAAQNPFHQAATAGGTAIREPGLLRVGRFERARPHDDG